MSNACAPRLRRSIAPIALLISVSGAPIAPAQAQGWTAAQNPMLPLIGFDTAAASTPSPIYQAPQIPRRGPLARLIENPDQTEGTPPYALTDQTGTIQRYVEPVPGIDLAANVGQIVVVRHDTGPTLLASQLDLPRESLRPLLSESQSGNSANSHSRGLPFPYARRPTAEASVQQAQYVDDDDMSVQLLPDDMSMPGGRGGQLPLMGDGYPGYPGQMMPGQMMPGQMMPGQMYGPDGYAQCGAPCCDQPYCDPMQCGPGMMQPYGPMVGPFPQPQFGGYPNYGPGPPQPCPTVADCPAPQRPKVYGDVEFLFYRVHFTDQVVGKLSEEYEFSPRFILGFRNVGPLDGRVRYWHYAHGTNVRGIPNGDIRVEWDVLDLEAVHYFEGRRSQLALAAGVRFADAKLEDTNELDCGSDMVGLTMAADGLTPVLRMRNGYCGWVYGGRISILGGDWGTDVDSDFILGPFRDDNIFVSELYAGAELACCIRGATVRGRILFDMQNWRSDALANDALESIGFIGPALQLGADF
jgi:hypothetical protein